VLVSVIGLSFSFFLYTASFPYSDVWFGSFGEIRLGVYLYVVVPEEVVLFVGSSFGPEVFKRSTSAFLSLV
jgi:hypothetical protein